VLQAQRGFHLTITFASQHGKGKKTAGRNTFGGRGKIR
jgi:hypothetical protein